MEWFRLDSAKRAEYRLLSLSMSTYLEIIHGDKIFVFDGLNKLKPSRRLFTIKENDVPTPADLIVFRNMKYILAISDKLYKAKDCDVVALPAVSFSSLKERLSELPDMGLPKFLFSDETGILYFYIPKNLYAKKGADEKIKNKIVPRLVITDYIPTGNRKFYDNSYPLPYVRKVTIFHNLFFVNIDFEYAIYEKDKDQNDYRVYFLPTEVLFQEFNFIPDKDESSDKEITGKSPFHLQATFNFEEEKVKLSIPELHETK